MARAAVRLASWPGIGLASLHARQTARLLRRRPPLRGFTERLDDRVVFVVGSPRSGTTFFAAALGSLPGFVDLGEVLPLKAAVPRLAALPPADAARRLRRTLRVSARLGGAAGVRPVEQTPETAFVARALPLAFPAATVIHLVRDGRDVVCSLLERGWLGESSARDDAGLAVGAAPRFWVEPSRRREFVDASEARRAAWAWRRYVESARRLGDRAHELRYERMCLDPSVVAQELASVVDASAHELERRLAAADAASVGRYRRELTGDRLVEVEAEAGALLADLGYS
jgi:Sulfotransferase domain